jgi:hypothetical protein
LLAINKNKIYKKKSTKILPELAVETEDILGALELADKCGVFSEGFPLIDKELMAHLHHNQDFKNSCQGWN